VHEELRRIARRCLDGERRGHSLQATDLVNEAYLRLVNVSRVRWQDRNHFLAMAARLMRRVLVDLARARLADKRGGGAIRITLDSSIVAVGGPGDDLVALDEALTALAAIDPRKAQVVELRFFGGLGVEATAQVLHVSTKTVKRDWDFARAWLQREVAQVRPA
jgi:RNA polymerase sigma factor (TIGR02999 family)